MFDNQLFSLIISTVIAGETTANIPGTPIAQAFQPQQQGVNTKQTAYLYKLFDELVGSPYEADVWDADTETMVHTQLQQYATHFQISVLATQNPATPTQYTASDILNLIASILQSSVTIATFEAQGVGIQKISAAQNPPFMDDRARFEFNPYVEFIVTHKQIITSTSPYTSIFEVQVIEI